jgi:hypothetical protein
MKTHKHISALLVVASALLSSCTLLVSSPLESPRPRPYTNLTKNFYNGIIEVPVDGGLYEFDCTDDKFYISKIFDSSMPVLSKNSDSRHSPETNNYIPVNDLTYTGSFYTITCNRKEHNWIIEIDPLISNPGELNDRDIWVYMWDGSGDYYFIFRFEQIDNNNYGYIE